MISQLGMASAMTMKIKGAALGDFGVVRASWRKWSSNLVPCGALR